jgi:hypothetical protein
MDYSRWQLIRSAVLGVGHAPYQVACGSTFAGHDKLHDWASKAASG